jgi:hypothetical protein
MLKRLMMAVLLVSALPVMVSAAWFLNTQVKSGGGTMDSRNKVGQTVGDGPLFQSYTTTANIPVTVTPAEGYSIGTVTMNGRNVEVTSTPFQVTIPGSESDKSVTATFLATGLTVKAATTNGTATPSSVNNVFYGYTLVSPITFSFTPSTGYAISTISGSPFTTGLTGTRSVSGTSPGWSVPGGTNQPATVTFPAGYIFLKPVDLVATAQNMTPTLDHIPQQSVTPGVLVKLQETRPAGVDPGATYQWQYVSGPANEAVLDPKTGTSYITIPKPDCPLTGATQLVATFTAPGTPGQYKFLFTMKNAYRDSNGAWQDLITLATVNVYATATSTAENQCQFCHSANGIGSQPPDGPRTLFNNWSSSKHKEKGIVCARCHVGADQGGHPGMPPNCSACHPNVHTWESEGVCLRCHDAHKPWPPTMAGYPHFSSYSTAQYVTPNLPSTVSCDSCHKRTPTAAAFDVYTANKEWAKSAHGNPRSTAYIGVGPYTEANLEAFDFKFLGTAGTTPSAMAASTNPATAAAKDCVRCHTSTGYVNYVTPADVNNPNSTTFTRMAPWGTAGDRTREMVSCPTCHTPTPFSATFSRRQVGTTLTVTPLGFDPISTAIVTAYFNYSSLETKKIRRSKALISFDNAGVPLFTGESNICIVCHSGRAVGDIIKQTSSPNCSSSPTIACRLGNGNQTTGSSNAFWSNADFIDPHGGCQANMLYPDNLRPAYEYRTATISSTSHAGIGVEPGPSGNAPGACVACHMSGPDKHTFTVLSSASNGVIGKARSMCYTCHGPSTFGFGADLSVLQGKKDGYIAALSFIKAQLAARNIYYNRSVPPYFFTKPDAASQTYANRTLNWQNADVMGAAFNLRLLDADNGWVHNGTYAKHVLYDTIDYLDGLPDYSVAATLGASPLTDSATRSRASSYILVGGTRP